MNGQLVIASMSSQTAWLGWLIESYDSTVVLAGAKPLWQHVTLTQTARELSERGPDSYWTELVMPVPRMTKKLKGCLEVIPVSPKAKKKFDSIPYWKPKK